ncbi:MAG: hypothetical protein J0L75_17260 [Spirochaetes bacterium]|nr:hypothetical protein [Spirochaetota bacterium]
MALVGGFAPLCAQADFSAEIAFRNYVPLAQPTIAARKGDVVHVNQAALWRRDSTAFPGLSDGLGVEFLWNRNKFSFGAGVDVFNGFYAVNSNLATNLSAFSDSSFDARIMTWGLHAKFLWHLKAEHLSSVFFGAKAGILLTGGGVAEWFGYHFFIPETSAKFFDRIPTADFSPGLCVSLLAGLRIYLIDKPIRPHAAGLRFTLEYSLATETLPFREGIWTGKGFAGFNQAPTYAFSASGLLVSVALFFTFTGRRAVLVSPPPP